MSTLIRIPDAAAPDDAASPPAACAADGLVAHELIMVEIEESASLIGEPAAMSEAAVEAGTALGPVAAQRGMRDSRLHRLAAGLNMFLDPAARAGAAIGAGARVASDALVAADGTVADGKDCLPPVAAVEDAAAIRRAAVLPRGAGSSDGHVVLEPAMADGERSDAGVAAIQNGTAKGIACRTGGVAGAAD